MATNVRVLYDDEYGTDTLIDDLHNVNYVTDDDCVFTATHTTRNGSRMQVLFNNTHKTYYVLVVIPPKGR